MEYIVLGQDGKEYGPVDPETLKKWVEHGRVLKDTQVRNALMMKWNEAGKLDVLAESFAVQHQNEEAEEGVGDKIMGALGLGKKKDDAPKEKEVRTAFVQKYIPNPASVGQRIGAFVFDSFIIIIFGAALFIMMNIYAGTTGLGDFSLGLVATSGEISDNTDSSSNNIDNAADGEAEKEEADVENVDDGESADVAPAVDEPFFVPEEVKANVPHLNHVFYKFFALFVAGVLLYYGIGLGLFAQTYGMHYWGIFIVKGYNDEALPARAFAFVIAMFAIGITTPLVVLLNPQHRSLHGYLTGTRLIRIAAKPKV